MVADGFNVSPEVEYDGFVSCEDAPVIVRVDGVTVPVVATHGNDDLAVETEIRKSGPSDMVRRSEVQFPIEDEGEPVTPVIEDFATVEILFRSHTDGEYRHVHTGPLSGHGPAAVGNGEIQRFLVSDYAQYFPNVSAQRTVENEKLWNLLTWVRDEFVSNTPVVDEMGIAVGGPEGEQVQSGIAGLDSGFLVGLDDFYDWLDGSVLGTDVFFTPQEFTHNRHDLADVMDFICKKKNLHWYTGYDHDEEMPVLVIDDQPTRPTFTGDHVGDGHGPDVADILDTVADFLGLEPALDAVETLLTDNTTDVEIINNNALFELSPTNMVVAKGRSRNSIQDLTEPIKYITDEGYPVGVAYHPRLVERSGGLLSQVEEEIGAVTVDGALNEAKKILKEMLDTEGHGRITMESTPSMRPYAQLLAVPVCGHAVQSGVEPINYEVEGVIHSHDPTADDRPFNMTEASVSLYVGTEEIESLDDPNEIEGAPESVETTRMVTP